MPLSPPGAQGARFRGHRIRAVLLGLAGLALPIFLACGTSAVSVGVCDTISTALCTRAAELNCSPNSDYGVDGGPSINLEVPPHVGGEADNAAACINWYVGSACLHGLGTSKAPVGQDVPNCVTAINSTKSCAIVANPQLDPACTWLIPPVDAGSDVEAASDVTEGGVIFDVKLDADASVDAKPDGKD
jgi:hypothetical protein